jgi:Mrp family chromosome partitioning ATPase
LPIVLIATLATLLLSAGSIATGELLRMTAPGLMASRAEPVVASPRPVARASVASFAAPDIAGADLLSHEKETVPLAAAMPEVIAPQGMPPEAPVDLTEIEQLADELRSAGEAARKVTILGTASSESITLTALTLARLLAREARVVVVDLSATSPTLSAISVDPAAPGLVELMLGEASFAQIITRDRLSRVHLVSAGRPGSDHTLLQSPRLTLAIDALLRVYDHVLLDAGLANDLPAELLTAQARAVVVPDASMATDARTQMCDQLKAVGFSDVTMLSGPSLPSDAVDPGLRVVAA